MAEAKWYVAHTYSGYENKVKTDLEKTIENRRLQDQILEVRVPVQDVVEVKGGVEKTSPKKLFPGYVLVNMVMNDDTWYVVRNTRGVTGFVGPGSKPVPLSDAEIAAMGVDNHEVVLDFEIGDSVLIKAEAWKDYHGVVRAINTEERTVTVHIDMLGRETPVELKFTDILSEN